MSIRRKMEKIKEIVRILYKIDPCDNVDINSYEYKFILHLYFSLKKH